MEPLGSRRRKSTEPPMFDPQAWKGWEPQSREKAVEESRTAMRRGVDSVTDMVDNFQGKIGDEHHQEVVHYSSIYKQLLGMLTEELGQGETAGLIGELEKGMGDLQSKMDSEEGEMKEITKLMSELEEEIKRYNSDRTTNKYNNIRARMGSLTKKLSTFKPGRQENQDLKATHNKRLSDLWKNFENRSESLVDMLEQQMGGPAGGRENESQSGGRGGADRKGEIRKTAVEEYRLDLTQHVRSLLEVCCITGASKVLPIQNCKTCLFQGNYSAKFVNNEASR